MLSDNLCKNARLSPAFWIQSCSYSLSSLDGRSRYILIKPSPLFFTTSYMYFYTQYTSRISWQH